MPESGKVTLKAQLASEVAHIRQLRPDVPRSSLSPTPPPTIGPSWRPCRPKPRSSTSGMPANISERHPTMRCDSDWFERYREVLRHDPCGVDKVIRALRHLRDSAKPDRAEIERELAFFRKHRQRMRYHALKAEGVAIGSGVVEAANKTLVTQRMKRSGMRWRIASGQAVLTFRALIKSLASTGHGRPSSSATDTPATTTSMPCRHRSLPELNESKPLLSMPYGLAPRPGASSRLSRPLAGQLAVTGSERLASKLAGGAGHEAAAAEFVDDRSSSWSFIPSIHSRARGPNTAAGRPGPDLRPLCSSSRGLAYSGR